MKEGIHPQYQETTITCACGFSFKTKSTKPVIKLEICSNCHPFFTGKQKLIDSAGRVEGFHKRFAKTDGKTVKKAAKVRKVEVRKVKGKVLSTSPKRKKLPALKTTAPKEAKETKKEK